MEKESKHEDLERPQAKKNHVSKCGLGDRARPQGGVARGAAGEEDPGSKRQRRLRRTSQQMVGDSLQRI